MVTFGARFKNFLDFKFISSDILKVFFLGCLNAYCLTPSITNSLGITSLDDGPIQPALAYKYGKLGVEFNPDNIDAWRTLHSLKNATAEDRKLAKENMIRLDPLNDEWKKLP